MLDAGGEADGGEDEVRGRDAIMEDHNWILEDFPRVTGRQLNFDNNETELMSFWR